MTKPEVQAFVIDKTERLRRSRFRKRLLLSGVRLVDYELASLPIAAADERNSALARRWPISASGNPVFYFDGIMSCVNPSG